MLLPKLGRQIKDAASLYHYSVSDVPNTDMLASITLRILFFMASHCRYWVFWMRHFMELMLCSHLRDVWIKPSPTSHSYFISSYRHQLDVKPTGITGKRRGPYFVPEPYSNTFRIHPQRNTSLYTTHPRDLAMFVFGEVMIKRADGFAVGHKWFDFLKNKSTEL